MERLEVGLERLHTLFLDMVKRRIDILDELTADADLEETGDAEPSLGSTGSTADGGASQLQWSRGVCSDLEKDDGDDDKDLGGVGDAQDQRNWARQGAPEGDGDCDGEPETGSLDGWIDQTSWERPPCALRWAVVDGGEPDLGSLGGTATDVRKDQRVWANAHGVVQSQLACRRAGGSRMYAADGMANDDREDVCEDEGAQCDDEGHDSDREALCTDDLGVCCNYTSYHDQRTVAHGILTPARGAY
jgi:hypothetical protein